MIRSKRSLVTIVFLWFALAGRADVAARTLDFYFISADGSCQFTFPQTGPGGNFSNGRITSVTLFESIPDTGAAIMLFAIALSGLGVIHRFAKQ